jgi:CelD/BcsL family acetyltransferase involved in cellulose biosynthesis
VSHAVRAGGRDVTVTTIDTLDGLMRLASTWRTLLARASNGSGFLTWEWVCSWSEVFVRDGRTLAVLVFECDGAVIGIAPLYREWQSRGLVSWKALVLLGHPEGGADYLDVIAARGKENLLAQALIAALYGPLARTWDTAQLFDVPGASPFMAQLFLELRRCGKHYLVMEGSYCPHVTLPASFDEFLNTMSPTSRQTYRRKLRGLQALGTVEHTIYRAVDDVRQALPDFRLLYERRWEKPVSDIFSVLDAYLGRSATAWRVELSLLRIDRQPVAGLVHLTSGRTTYQYIMAVDRTFNPSLSIGHLLCCMNLAAAIDAGFETYDFLKGEEQHKLRLMTGASRSLHTTLYNRSLRSFANGVITAASAPGKIILR